MNLSHPQQEEIISFTRELVKLPGESGEESRTADCVASKMKDLGYDEVSVDEFGNVLGILTGEQPGPTILFDGHMDVVPVREADAWHHKPYSAEISDGKIWGRGTSDMKGALAAMICAPAYLGRSEFSGRILVSASVAEELLIGFAFSRILERYPADAVVVGEPTGLKLGIAEKGRAGIEMISHGTVAHSSRPELGDNAVYRMMEAIERIKALPRRSHPFLGEEVIELVEISSLPSPGNGSIPGECRTFWECRLLHGESRKSFLGRWKAALKGMDKVDIKIARYGLVSYTGETMSMDDFLPGWLSQEDQVFTLLAEESIRHCEADVEFFAAPYGCNALASAGENRIPTIILGPGNIDQAHKPNESIEIKELLMSARIYASLARKFCSL